MSANVLVSTENMPYEDWLEYRKQGIGGSDAAVACGISRYKSQVELWLEKAGQLPAQEAGEAAYWGTQLEPLVRAEFTRRTGIEVAHTMQLLQSTEHPFMLANLDGTCEHPDFGPCVFEAKTASAYKAKEWDNSIPEEYLLQIQHYMAVIAVVRHGHLLAADDADLHRPLCRRFACLFDIVLFVCHLNSSFTCFFRLRKRKKRRTRADHKVETRIRRSSRLCDCRPLGRLALLPSRQGLPVPRSLGGHALHRLPPGPAPGLGQAHSGISRTLSIGNLVANCYSFSL